LRVSARAIACQNYPQLSRHAVTAGRSTKLRVWPTGDTETRYPQLGPSACPCLQAPRIAGVFAVTIVRPSHATQRQRKLGPARMASCVYQSVNSDQTQSSCGIPSPGSALMLLPFGRVLYMAPPYASILLSEAPPRGTEVRAGNPEYRGSRLSRYLFWYVTCV